MIELLFIVPAIGVAFMLLMDIRSNTSESSNL